MFLSLLLFSVDVLISYACYSIFIANLLSQFVCSMQQVFLEIYVRSVLNAKDKPPRVLGEAFQPLFTRMEHENFKNLVHPSAIKALKRNPEVVLESIGDLLKMVNLDLSKYVSEFLSVVLPQARHADEGRRTGALTVIRFLSQKCSDPDSLPSIFNAVKAVLGGWFYYYYYY